MENHFNSSK